MRLLERMVVTPRLRLGVLLVLLAGGVGLKTSVPFNEALFNVLVEIVIGHFIVLSEGHLVEGIRWTSCVGVVGNVVGTERHHGLEEGQKLPGKTVHTSTIEKLG